MKNLIQLRKQTPICGVLANFRRVCISLVFILIAGAFGQAATITSTSSGGDWAVGSTWVGGVVPATSDAVVIATTGGANVSISTTVTQTSAGSVTINNGSILNVNTLSISVNFGSLTISSGATLNISRSMTVQGATSISGTINFGSTVSNGRTMTFTGDVTLNSGAVWTEPASGTGANNTYSFSGNFTNNASSFLARGTGTHTFRGTNKTISGSTTTSIPKISVTGTTTNTGTIIASTLLSVSSITLTNNGTITALTSLSGTGRLTQGTNAVLYITGTSGITTLTATASGNTVYFNGAAGQMVKATNYHHLVLSGSGSKILYTGTTTIGGNFTMSGTATTTTVVNMTIAGTMTIGAGTVFTQGATYTLGVTGATSISGTYTDGSTGTKTFTGDITLNSGAVWNETVASAYSIAGNFTNNATTFTANSGVHTFSGASKTIGGSTTNVIPNATFSGSYTNNGTLTVNTALAGAGTLTQGSNSVLNIGGTASVGTLAASVNVNTVNYTGSNQTLNSGNYYHLNLNGSGTKTFQAGTSTIAGNLSLLGTASSVSGANLSVSGNLDIAAGTTLGLTSTHTFAVTGTSAISGTYSDGSSGNKTFTGQITLNSGAVWSETVASAYSIAGSVVNNAATFSASTGLHTFTGSSKSLSGSTAISVPNISITGSYTNNGTLSATTSLAGAGSLVLGASSTLNLGGTTTISSLNTSATGNTVNYNGASQTVYNTNYYHLALSGSGTKTFQTGTTTIAGNFSTSGTITATAVTGLSISGFVSIGSGTTFSGASYTHTVYDNWTTLGTFTAATSTINLAGVAQTISGNTTFNNLTFGGTGGKTIPNGTIVTVNGILSIENGTSTNIYAGSLVYGAAATLKYNSSTALTASAEWISPFTATGGVLIAGTGTVTLDADKIFNSSVPLTINANASLNTDGVNNRSLSFGGNFVNSGTLTANASTIKLSGTMSSQSIASFSTTGTVEVTKTSGTATFQGNVSANALTMNGVGGTLNLGSGLSHSFSGDITLTAGTLNGGSSTMTVLSSTATAWTGTGSNFIPATSTVNFNGANQTIATATTFYNLVLGGSGTKTINSVSTTNNNFSIGKNVVVDLSTGLTHSAQYLYFSGVNQTGGTGISWGGTGSGATFINATYFSATTGKLNVTATSPCGTNTWSGAVSTDWNNASNWCSGVPSLVTNVIIPGNASRQPVISATASCDAITIQSGASLTISGSNSLTVAGDWVNNGTFTANTSTVTFSDPVGQTISGTSTTTFRNLTLAQGGLITFATVPTINGILSMEGNSVSVAPNYGASATLQYNSAGSVTTGYEWVSPFVATGGVVIKNTGLVTLNGAKQMGNSTNVALNINANARLSTGNFGLIFDGDFINSGTFTAGSSNITIDGTQSAQNIAGITTTGSFSCNKSAGTATLTGNLNAGSLTNSTAGGTLHLGTSLSHTITGDWVRTNGTLNGGSSTLTIGGNVTNTAGTFVAGTSTVNYNGSAQSTASVNYYNLTLSGTGTKTMQSGTSSVSNNLTLSGTASVPLAANLSIGANLTTGAGTSLSTSSNYTLSVTGTSSISGTYSDGSTGSKSFTGNITLNSGAIWTETVASAYSFAGSFTNNGTSFTGHNGVHTFSGTAKTLSGSATINIPNATFTGTYTNNGTLAVSSALAGSGSLTQGSASTLNLGGTVTISTLNASTNQNTVNYNGSSQTVYAINYSDLILSGSGTKTHQSATTSLSGSLTLSGSATFSPVAALTVSGNVNIGAGTTFTAGSYTHNVAGNWTKNGTFTATGSTINFNGSSAQNIGSSNFNHISFSGSGTATATGALSVVGNLTISTNFSAGNYTHTVQGNWVNNGTFQAGTSTISLTGSTAQSISGSNSTTFYNLNQNGTGLVTLGISTVVSGNLGLQLGNFDLTGYDMTVGSTSGGSVNSYVVTSGSGKLIQYIDYNLTKNFPVGKSAYNPVSVKNNTSGGGDYFHVNVTDDVLTTANDNTKTVSRQWFLNKTNEGTANLTMAFTYNQGEAQNNFNAATNPKTGIYNGTLWNSYTATVNGYTFTSTANVAHTSGSTQFVAIGSGDAFDASKFGLTIDPTSPVRGSASTQVVVQTLNSNDVLTYASSDIEFALSATNTSISGTPTGTILSGTYSTTVSGVTLTATTWNDTEQLYDSIATITATQTNGLVGTSHVFAVVDGTIYEPVATQNWDAVDGWKKSTDGGTTWTNPATLPANNVFSETEVIRIPSGITLTANTSVSFFSMLVYGTLVLDPQGSLTVTHNEIDALDNDYNLHIEGTFQNSGGSFVNTDNGFPIHFRGGTYIHAMNGGGIPLGTWISNGPKSSTCEVTGLTSTALTGLNQHFENFNWNNSNQAVTQYLDGDMLVTDSLRLTNGVITTTSNHVIESSSGTLVRTNGYVNGNFRLYVPNLNAPTVVFPVGDANYYTPISIAFSGTVSGSGFIDAFTAVAQPPVASGLSQSKYINRRWNIQNNGVAGFTSYAATFTCNDNDKIGNPTLANLVVRKLSGSTWYALPTNTPNSNAVTCTGLTDFSDFYIGETDCSATNALWFGSVNSDWNTAGNWCSNTVPTSTSNVTIPAGITNYPVIGSGGGTCNSVTIQSGASLSVSGTYTLDVKGNWTNSGTFNASTSTVSFTGSTAQTISGNTNFNNLTINNTAGVVAASGFTVGGQLTLSSANPDATHGTLDMATYTLQMTSATATVSGTGDVSGTVKRTHTFTPNVQYRFGSQYTTITLLGVGTAPDELTCKIELGVGIPAGGTSKSFVNRNYNFNQTGTTGTDRVAVNLRYLASELNGQDEAKLVVWDHHPSDNRTEEHGKTNSNTTDKWVGLSGFSLNYIAPAPSNPNAAKKFGLSNYVTTKKTWTGSSNTDWNNPDNWSPTVVPVTTDDVLIPEVQTVYPVLTSDAEIKTLEIAASASLSASSYNLTINGYTGAWTNNGTFNAGSGTVRFTHGINTHVVTASGNTQFNNIYFGENTYLRPGSNTHMKISGLASGELSSIVDLSAVGNTVEYNGTDQYFSNPATVGFEVTGYYNLIISGSGTKTLVATDHLNIAGNFTNNGTVDFGESTVYFCGTAAQTIGGSSVTTFKHLAVTNTAGVTALNDINVNGNVNLTTNPSDSKGSLDMGSYTMEYGSDATDIGVGDVTGNIHRSSLVASKSYTFGHPHTSVVFAPNAGTLPSQITIHTRFGAAPTWKTSTVNRVYTLAQSGGVNNKATLHIHYLDNELNGNSEELLVPWYYVYSTVVEGTTRSSFDTQNNFVTLSNVNFNFPSGAECSLGNTTASSCTWTGAASTDWTNSANWYNAVLPTSSSHVIIPDASTLPNSPTLSANDTIASVQIASGGILTAVEGGQLRLTGSSGTWNNSGTFIPSTSTVIFANGTDATLAGNTDFYNISITSGTRLACQSGATIGIYGQVTNNGIWSLISQGTTTVDYKGADQTVVIPNAAQNKYYNLILSGSGTKTMPAQAIEVLGDFTLSGTATVAMVRAMTFDGNVTLNSGTGFTAGAYSHTVAGNWINNGTTLDVSGSTFTFSNTVAQTIGGTATATFNHLNINNTSTVSIPNNLVLNGTLTFSDASTTLNLGGNFENNGTVNLDKGTVAFNGASPQSISGTSVFNNLTVSNLSGLTSASNQTVNAVLNLTTNPDATHGSLDMGSNTLSLGVNATNTGIGDVTGIVKRQHTFTGGVPYTFGNPYTSINFLNVDGGVKPQWISLKIAIGATPSWNVNAIKRYYSFAQEASGTDRTITSLHYLDSELNGNTDETKLVFWDAYTGPDFTTHYPRSHTNYSPDNNWIGLTGMAINFMAPSSQSDYKQWSLGYSNVNKITWTGNGSPTYYGDWNLPGNWNGGVPTAKDDVVIPAEADLPPDTHGLPFRNLLSAPAICKSLEIKPGATFSANNYDITIYGSTDAWVNNGTFIPGTGTVTFANGSTSNTVVLSGNTDFNNVVVNNNTLLQVASGSVVKINGTLTAQSGSILDFNTSNNTVEYNGNSQQNVVNPNGGYHNLVLSGNSTKVLPSSPVTVANNLTINGTSTTVNASNSLSVGDTLIVNENTILDMKTYPLREMNVNTGAGVLKTQNTGATPIPSGKTWTSGVVYNSNSNQTVVDGTYSSLQISNAVKTAAGDLNTSTLTVDNAAVLDMGANALVTMASNAGAGTLRTQNTSSNPIPSGKTWTSKVVYNGTAAQSVVNGAYNALQISNTSAATATGEINTTTLTVDNGATMDMGTHALASMTTNTGTGTLKTQNTGSTPVPAGKTWTGTVVFNAASPQTSPEGSFNNLTIDNAGGVSVAAASNVNVSGELLVNNSKKLIIPTETAVDAQTVSNNGGSAGITVQSSASAPNGSLIFRNQSSSPVYATIEMYSKAAATTYNPTTKTYSNYKWQFFGIPLESVVANPTFYGSFVRKHNEAGTSSSTLWVTQSNTSVLVPFAGYEVTQPTAKVITFQGKLVNGDFSETLTVTPGALYPGQHIYSNPYTAAIDITKIRFGADMDSSVYVYNTGSYLDWTSQNSSGDNPGQYTAIPKNTAGIGGIQGQIPSMQGFLVTANQSSSKATINIPYSAVIAKNNYKQKAPALGSSGAIFTRIDIAGSRYTDKMWIITNAACSHGYNNGWDGTKLLGASAAPQIWAMETAGDYQVNSVDNINNTRVAFMKGENTTYTMTFTHESPVSAYGALYLIDKEENRTVDISTSGTQYSFSATQTGIPTTARFEIVTNPSLATGLLQNQLSFDLYNVGKTLFFNNFTDSVLNLNICDVTGRVLSSHRIEHGRTSLPTNLTNGVYVIRVSGGKGLVVKQIVIN